MESACGGLVRSRDSAAEARKAAGLVAVVSGEYDEREEVLLRAGRRYEIVDERPHRGGVRESDSSFSSDLDD